MFKIFTEKVLSLDWRRSEKDYIFLSSCCIIALRKEYSLLGIVAAI